MNNQRMNTIKALLALGVALPVAVWAGNGQDQAHNFPADAVVDFGYPLPLPTPAPANINQVFPNEMTIQKGGTVTFLVNGGGHGLAIYPVSRNTTRQDIEADLCQGGASVCNATTQTANARYQITDGKGYVIIDTDANPPKSRINDPLGRLLYSGDVFLTGTTATAAGTQLQYRFEKTGRYLVPCINRGHFINNWMFGFVNVVGDDAQDD